MSLIIAWAIVLTSGHLMGKWVDRNNKKARKRTPKENYIIELNKK